VAVWPHRGQAWSELARERLKNAALNQARRVIVDDHREQARSYKDWVHNISMCTAALLVGAGARLRLASDGGLSHGDPVCRQKAGFTLVPK
jgi:hypothetical protein